MGNNEAQPTEKPQWTNGETTMAHSYAKLDSLASNLVAARAEYNRTASLNVGTIRGATDLSDAGALVMGLRSQLRIMVESMLSVGFRPDAIDRHTTQVKMDVLELTNNARLVRETEREIKRERNR